VRPRDPWHPGPASTLGPRKVRSPDAWCVFAFAFVIPRLPQVLTHVSFTPMGDDGGRDGDIVAAPGP
jgi:hypothetical protein